MPCPTLPVSLYVSDKKVLLVGDTELADERARRLEAAGATVVRLRAGELDDAHFVGSFALFAHTDDDDHNRDLAIRAGAAGLLAYAHDQPDCSDFAMPALVSVGPLKVAISTNGTSPALARRLREELTRLFSENTELGRFIDDLGERREALPRGQRGELYLVASRLRIEGAIKIDD